MGQKKDATLSASCKIPRQFRLLTQQRPKYAIILETNPDSLLFTTPSSLRLVQLPYAGYKKASFSLILVVFKLCMPSSYDTNPGECRMRAFLFQNHPLKQSLSVGQFT
jgi:hypothetical protein